MKPGIVSPCIEPIAFDRRDESVNVAHRTHLQATPGILSLRPSSATPSLTSDTKLELIS